VRPQEYILKDSLCFLFPRLQECHSGLLLAKERSSRCLSNDHPKGKPTTGLTKCCSWILLIDVGDSCKGGYSITFFVFRLPSSSFYSIYLSLSLSLSLSLGPSHRRSTLLARRLTVVPTEVTARDHPRMALSLPHSLIGSRGTGAGSRGCVGEWPPQACVSEPRVDRRRECACRPRVSARLLA
jgi:hypothetical protein